MINRGFCSSGDWKSLDTLTVIGEEKTAVPCTLRLFVYLARLFIYLSRKPLRERSDDVADGFLERSSLSREARPKSVLG